MYFNYLTVGERSKKKLWATCLNFVNLGIE
jgi:hypothetical protein